MTQTAPDPFRYVLGEDAPLVKNLAALWTVEPALADAIEALHPRPSYSITPSKSGVPTVSVPAPEGRTITLHSRYEPIDEARRLVTPIAVDEKLAFYLFGLGLGYHLELLFDQEGDEALFFVFEPDLLLI